MRHVLASSTLAMLLSLMMIYPTITKAAGESGESGENFIPIGFNNDSYFAYWDKKYNAETGCQVWEFHIIDVPTNRSVYSTATYADGCNMGYSLDVLKKRLQRLTKTRLKKHAIDDTERLAVHKFPLTRAGQDMTVSLSKSTQTLPVDVPNMTTHAISIKLITATSAKEVNVFFGLEVSGKKLSYDLKIDHYVINKNKDQLILIGSNAVRGKHGAPDYRNNLIYSTTLP